MYRQMNKNKGFTLIELLISMALLSIIMVMVVQFMSSTAGANKKTQYNLKAQSVANEVISNISESLMRAEYVMVVPANQSYYKMDPNITNRRESLTATNIALTTFPTNCRLVPDNYGNYARPSATEPERKVIVDLLSYELPGEKSGDVYPLATDLEQDGFNVRSFRILKQSLGSTEAYLYIEPAYIYIEYTVMSSSGTENLCYVIYRFDNEKIYMYRSSEKVNLDRYTPRFATAKSNVDALTKKEGLLTENVTDFYLSADAEGEAFMLNSLFNVNGYMFNSVTTVNFRNSQVLTVRPQNLYQKDNGSSGGSGGTGGGSGGTGGGTGDSDENTGGGVLPPDTP